MLIDNNNFFGGTFMNLSTIPETMNMHGTVNEVYTIKCRVSNPWLLNEKRLCFMPTQNNAYDAISKFCINSIFFLFGPAQRSNAGLNKNRRIMGSDRIRLDKLLSDRNTQL